MKRLFFLLLLAPCTFLAAFVRGQLFVPLGLGIETPVDMVVDFQPQMYVEGDILYVCTKQGLYAKDLKADGSEWQLAGFEGIPVLDYVRKGDEVYALCFDGDKDMLVLSHDGGRTFEDVTPEDFKEYTSREGHLFWYFAAHPTDPDTFLLSSFMEAGVFLTTDFGETWRKLSAYTPNYIGFHPLKPEIIYECGGGGFTDEKTDFRISYDGGQTWEGKADDFPNHNYVYRPAFHPTNPDCWIAGGNRYAYTTRDNGLTWEMQYFGDDEAQFADWRYATYDNENADIVYMAGGRHHQYMKLMCSTDGGTTWSKPYLEPIKTTPREYVFDMKQYRDKLLIYSQTDVYMVSKTDLIEKTTGIEEMKNEKFKIKNEADATYDLSGRRLSNGKIVKSSNSAVVIQGGKKWLRP